MKLAVVVVGDGRKQYLDQCVPAITEHVLHPISARIMVNDEADAGYCTRLADEYPEWHHVATWRSGMAGAVQAGFNAARAFTPDYVLWVEEDMLLTARLPISEAAAILERRTNLAQVTFPREPWGGNPIEMEAGQLAAIERLAPHFWHFDDHAEHDHLFSLNPCLIPGRMLDYGWDPDNEAGMTAKLLRLGYRFGAMRGEYARHIGHARSAQWSL